MKRSLLGLIALIFSGAPASANLTTWCSARVFAPDTGTTTKSGTNAVSCLGDFGDYSRELSSATASYDWLYVSAFGDDWWGMPGMDFASGAEASFEQHITFTGREGSGFLSFLGCPEDNYYSRVEVNIPYTRGVGEMCDDLNDPSWAGAVNLEPIIFSEPLTVRASVTAYTSSAWALARFRVAALRVYDSDLRLLGEWRDIIQAEDATYTLTSEIPEPGTWALVAAGLVGLCVRRRAWHGRESGEYLRY